jgi:hypothetical protein
MVSKIRKRDGRITDFDQAKIASSITRAGRKTGSGDELLSEELASVITLFLEKTCGQGIPSVGDVRDVVERILMETGHPDAARAFILHSERRKKRRDALRVLDVEGGADEDRGLEVDHASRGAISPWSKARIVSDLVDEAGFEPSLAAEIAAEVEDRVFRSGLVRISSSLIRELVDNELFNRGYSGHTFGRMHLGLSAEEVRTLTESDAGGLTPRDVSSSVTDSIVQQFSLREIYSPEEVEAHLRGEAVQEGLALPSGYLELTVDPRRLPAPFGSAAAPPAYVGSILRFLEHFAAGPVTVDLTDAGLERLCLAGDDPENWAREVVMNLARGPAGVRVLRAGAAVRLRRSLSPSGAMILENAGMQMKTAQDLLDEIAAAFLAAVSELGRELSLPALRIDLVGSRPPGDDLLSRLVVMETAGRVRLSAQGFDVEALAAVEPVMSGARLDVQAIQAASGRVNGESLTRALRETVATAAAAFGSKSRYLAGLLRKGRGPKAALRRFMGGDGGIVGPGTFRLSLRRLGRAGLMAARETGTAEGGAEAFTASVLKTVQVAAAEEERRLGLSIRIDPPWLQPDRELSEMIEGTPEAAAETTSSLGRFTGLDTLPDFFIGEARSRMEFLQAVLKVRSELDHAT